MDVRIVFFHILVVTLEKRLLVLVLVFVSPIIRILKLLMQKNNQF